LLRGWIRFLRSQDFEDMRKVDEAPNSSDGLMKLVDEAMK
jgi:hypothetical protein